MKTAILTTILTAVALSATISLASAQVAGGPNNNSGGGATSVTHGNGGNDTPGATQRPCSAKRPCPPPIRTANPRQAGSDDRCSCENLYIKTSTGAQLKKICFSTNTTTMVRFECLPPLRR